MSNKEIVQDEKAAGVTRDAKSCLRLKIVLEVAIFYFFEMIYLITKMSMSKNNDGQTGYFVVWGFQITFICISLFCYMIYICVTSSLDLLSSNKPYYAFFCFIIVTIIFDIIGFVVVADFCQNKLDEYEKDQSITCQDYFEGPLCRPQNNNVDFITAQDNFYMLNSGAIYWSIFSGILSLVVWCCIEKKVNR